MRSRLASLERAPAAPTPSAPARDLIDTLGPGQPLDPQTQQRMETVFSDDFSGVRVHVGPEAGEASRRVSAEALTVGEDIAFAPGRYQPGTPIGDALLAHELAHTIQQRDATATATAAATAAAPAVEPVGSALETDADAATAGVLRTLWSSTLSATTAGFRQTRPALRSGLRVQRCSCGGSQPRYAAPDGSGLTFDSRGFRPTAADDLVISEPAPDWVDVRPLYRARGQARVHGATDAAARGWDAGFLQTALTAERSANYARPGNVHHRRHVTGLESAARDGADGVPEPWYARPRPFASTDSERDVDMEDAPLMRRPRDSDDGQARLVSTSGHDTFRSWLVVRQRTTEDVVFLNWDAWEVNWNATFPTGQSGGISHGGVHITEPHGDGKGGVEPVLDGPLANDLLRQNAHWEPWP